MRATRKCLRVSVSGAVMDYRLCAMEAHEGGYALYTERPGRLVQVLQVTAQDTQEATRSKKPAGPLRAAAQSALAPPPPPLGSRHLELELDTRPGAQCGGRSRWWW
jgi:hypothetical protein